MRINQALLIAATLVVGEVFDGESKTATAAFPLRIMKETPGEKNVRLEKLSEQYRQWSESARAVGDQARASLFSNASQVVLQTGFAGFTYYNDLKGPVLLYDSVEKMDPNRGNLCPRRTKPCTY